MHRLHHSPCTPSNLSHRSSHSVVSFNRTFLWCTHAVSMVFPTRRIIRHHQIREQPDLLDLGHVCDFQARRIVQVGVSSVDKTYTMYCKTGCAGSHKTTCASRHRNHHTPKEILLLLRAVR
ncbi:hypothetical protein CY34DRAFT_366130 [Suillus luteus UH-Slu-Lm8-n1]|uniref:Uncharacterized protein n=1 Tax=Suillus luteus UH-Slu-Lm8-n1 TaxID=930992 RepID=A0A0D0B4V1_9AGAM|nr:hypothetical protein CY34DRAFT_366130 [Suillus luteus UH-Slu-Lm8-n1]